MWAFFIIIKQTSLSNSNLLNTCIKYKPHVNPSHFILLYPYISYYIKPQNTLYIFYIFTPHLHPHKHQSPYHPPHFLPVYQLLLHQCHYRHRILHKSTAIHSAGKINFQSVIRFNSLLIVF